MATVQKSMNSLDISAFDTDGSTDWSVLRLRLDGSVENTVQIDLGVANVVDGLFQSSIHVDFLHGDLKLLAPDEDTSGYFGFSCSMSNSRFVVGAPRVDSNKGAAYLYDFDGNVIKKLSSGSDGQSNDDFGYSVSIDEKIVVGTDSYTSTGDYVRVFSQEGIYERTIKCNGCDAFGQFLDTFGDKTVIVGSQNNSWKLFIYSTTTGNLLKVLESVYELSGVSMSEEFIVSTAYYGGTIVYSNTGTDYQKIVEIQQGGQTVATFGERIVIGNTFSGYNAPAYLYNTDGSFIKDLSPSLFTTFYYYGASVDITADKVFVSEPLTIGGESVVYTFSASTGEFKEKIVAPDDNDEYFGMSVCASGSHYVVGASRVDSAGGIVDTGAAYLFV